MTKTGKSSVPAWLTPVFKPESNTSQDDVNVTTEFNKYDASRSPYSAEAKSTENRSSREELLLAAGIDSSVDDSSLPCLTLRMWVISIVLTVVVSGLNTLYSLRKPSITLDSAVVQLIAFPIGKAWEKILPDYTLSIFGAKLRLNPGRFNEKIIIEYQLTLSLKEHILICMSSSLL
ncbi:hypothetical protein E4T49_07628 [Aureobasidium sp. EXF-10728]|nr:hypothetical protein E4T49_07628 [Aureobasidium sp. EXF-10728]